MCRRGGCEPSTVLLLVAGRVKLGMGHSVNNRTANPKSEDTRVSIHKTELISDLKIHLGAVSSIYIPEPWETEAGKYPEFEANLEI